jgi:ribosome-associated protein
MIQITETLSIPDKQIRRRFVRAEGDRGQNKDHDAIAVELRFDITKSSLPLDIRERLLRIAGKHVTAAGVLRVMSKASRSQAKNLTLARTRLLRLLKRAASAPKVRRITRPPLIEREVRLAAKHMRAEIKRLRHP